MSTPAPGRWQWTLQRSGYHAIQHKQPHQQRFQTVQRPARCRCDQQGSRQLCHLLGCPSHDHGYNGGLGYQLFNHSQINDAFSVIWNHTFSPTFLNEARANAAGWRYNELGSNPQAPFGLPQDSYLL
jgi:hypothetical protein